MKNLLVSIIIPCQSEKNNIDGLLKDISHQKISFATEVIKIINISPPAKARNEGARKAKGEILVFIDCDIRLASELFLADLLSPLIEDRNIGQIYASVRIPPHASKFQVRYAKEIVHSQTPPVDKLTDAAAAQTTCCAMFKGVFLKMNGFNEKIIRGEDSLLSLQLIKAGYRVVITPYAIVYHPPPANFIELIKENFRNGIGVFFVDTFYPDLNLDVHPKGNIYFSEKKSKFERTQRFLLSFFSATFQGKFLLLSTKLTYIFAYLYAFLKYRIAKNQTLY